MKSRRTSWSRATRLTSACARGTASASASVVTGPFCPAGDLRTVSEVPLVFVAGTRRDGLRPVNAERPELEGAAVEWTAGEMPFWDCRCCHDLTVNVNLAGSHDDDQSSWLLPQAIVTVVGACRRSLRSEPAGTWVMLSGSSSVGLDGHHRQTRVGPAAVLQFDGDRERSNLRSCRPERRGDIRGEVRGRARARGERRRRRGHTHHGDRPDPGPDQGTTAETCRPRARASQQTPVLLKR